jgi:hypothetical protein
MGERSCIADHDEPLTGTTEHHIDALRLLEEANTALAVAAHQGHQDDVALLTLQM